MTQQEYVVSIAAEEVGYLEKKSRSSLDDKTANAGTANITKYSRDMDAIKDYYNTPKQGAAWCDIFVDWVFVKAFGAEKGRKMLFQPLKSAGAGVKCSAQYFKDARRWYTSPQVGDQIFYKNSSGALVHTGIVEKIANGRVYTIEGNTSSAAGVVANGGGVFRKNYALNYARIAGYGRPLWDSEPVKAPTKTETKTEDKKVNVELTQLHKGSKGAEVLTLQRLLRALGYTDAKKKPIEIDGDFGTATDAALRKFQKARALEVDGYCGVKTWSKLLKGV